ncbi:hypothetical protein L2D14_04550 [Thalassospiraceae bacterium LMO-JJ14]|nr:hypothetical protein L2D14_04550 [Thalassospiraceae bacterium LMO-JJ14]
MKHSVWIAALALTLPAGLAEAETAEGKRDGIYQIVKATESRVWRLNTETGEIAVCELSGENLVCTSTSNAAEVPKKSYAEIEAERAEAQKAADAQRQAERERELKFLDKILALFRELLQTAMGTAPGS